MTGHRAVVEGGDEPLNRHAPSRSQPARIAIAERSGILPDEAGGFWKRPYRKVAAYLTRFAASAASCVRLLTLTLA